MVDKKLKSHPLITASEPEVRATLGDFLDVQFTAVEAACHDESFEWAKRNQADLVILAKSPEREKSRRPKDRCKSNVFTKKIKKANYSSKSFYIQDHVIFEITSQQQT
jgi:hypothetical protein